MVSFSTAYIFYYYQALNESEEAESTTNVMVEKSDSTTSDSSKLQPESIVTGTSPKEEGSDNMCHPVLLSHRKAVTNKAYGVYLMKGVMNQSVKMNIPVSM